MMNLSKFILIALLFPTSSLAATGDILYSNCAGGTCTGAYTDTGITRTVETSGCQSGNCLKLLATWNGTAYGHDNPVITASGIAGNEITIVFYQKFNKQARTISGANIKAFRPYTGDSAYYFAAMSPHFGYDYYCSANTGPMTITSAVSDIHTLYGYSEPLGGYNYTNPDGRFEFNFNIGEQDGFGAYWTKVRHWMKLPSPDGSSNGESKIWINEELVATFTGQSASASADTTFNGLNFYPSSVADESFEQWMDEMVVYEGYVPPDAAPQNGRMQAGSFSGSFR